MDFGSSKWEGRPRGGLSPGRVEKTGWSEKPLDAVRTGGGEAV